MYICMYDLLPEVVEYLFSLDGLSLGEGDEHGAAVLRHSDRAARVGRLELPQAADEARLVAAQQAIEVVVEDEGASAVEDVGDAAHDEVLVEGQEGGVDLADAALLAERGDEGDGREDEALLAQAVEDGVGLGGDDADGGGVEARQVADGLVVGRVQPEEEGHGVACLLRVAADGHEALVHVAGVAVEVEHVADGEMTRHR
jgi:hypothetical protein